TPPPLRPPPSSHPFLFSLLSSPSSLSLPLFISLLHPLSILPPSSLHPLSLHPPASLSPSSLHPPSILSPSSLHPSPSPSTPLSILPPFSLHPPCLPVLLFSHSLS